MNTLKALFDLLNGAHLAQDCFGRGRNWLYQRLNGNLVNGKPAQFTPEQKKQLAEYLKAKAEEMLAVAQELEQTT